MNVEYCNRLRELYNVFPDSFWKRLFSELEERVGRMRIEAETREFGDVSTYGAFKDLLELETPRRNAVQNRRNAFCLTNDERAWFIGGDA